MNPVHPVPASSTAAPAAASALHEIRYSLPEMLAELQLERTSGTFSQGKLQQAEIGKLFHNPKKRRVKNT
ncbi:MAG: hypothetical protein JF599_06215 [Verrucomicrobia bacterium]|nr:hypothetical protein [Verrucomicrobiota bacterium]